MESAESAEQRPLAIAVTVYSMAGSMLVDRAPVPAKQCTTAKEFHASIARNLPAPAHALYYSFASPRFSDPIFAVRLDADTGVTQDNDTLVSELCVGGPLVDGESIVAQVAILRSELGQVLQEEAEAFAHAMEDARYALRPCQAQCFATRADLRAWWEAEQADLCRQVREEREAFAHAMEDARYTLKPCQEQCFATRADLRARWEAEQADLCRQVEEERAAFRRATDGAEYACPCGDVCSGVFRSRDELAEHLRGAHPRGIKLFPCDGERRRQWARTRRALRLSRVTASPAGSGRGAR